MPDFSPFDGYRGKLVHATTMSVVHWTVDADCVAPIHSHPHEQIINMIEGEFELEMDGECVTLKPGDIIVVPGDVPHGGRAITDCKIIDVWHPQREDYQVI